MEKLLMPRAVAAWLISNTMLSFKQIAIFCSMHELEVKNIANAYNNILERNPIENNQLTYEEIKRCEADPLATLQIKQQDIVTTKKNKTKKYIPLIKRKNVPNAIAWLIKKYSYCTDIEIAKLIGSTKNTVNKIRQNFADNPGDYNIINPADINLCSFESIIELENKNEQIKQLDNKQPPE